MFERLLVIPDRDSVEQPAVERAASLAVPPGTEIEVFSPVYEPLLEAYYGNEKIHESLRRRAVAEGLAATRQLAEKLNARGRVATADAVWDHPLHLAIARRVVAHDIDLVLMRPREGSQGGLSHAEWQLISTCPAPVLVVRSDGATQYRRLVAAVDPLHAHAKPADLDQAILSHAKALQTQLGADLEVAHCYVPLTRLGIGADVGQLPLDDAERALEEGRRQALEQLVADAGLPASAIKLRPGSPEVVLQRMMDRGDADLVIMGALSRGRLRDFLIGSTAEKLLQRSRGDVLTIKPPGISFAA
jgi:universal stress protein E